MAFPRFAAMESKMQTTIAIREFSREIRATLSGVPTLLS